ncbi:cell division inhibitor SulA [Edwardsiella hoshinae]|uniref:Cell division inhibitor SulA n=1 Tax=Edwardsiella hoshinae TaxID=93378 RepID=A0A376DIU4_9GAMM|nr:SOS-induced cell division inhibitor SulA [Edwardsiella hoshinae]QPR26726.1 cell division inhibitor SulA [Edwardsiella hoshinae]STC89585.1 Cell division inhibitor SulA [Edwardsiella hoshinae]
MRTSSLPPASDRVLFSRPAYAPTALVPQSGFVSELGYGDQHPLLSLLLPPLLRQLGEQSRWQLWITAQHKPNKQWLAACGVPVNKVMQLQRAEAGEAIHAMEQALRSGNYSVVLGWLPPLTAAERLRLNQAAKVGNSIGLLMQPWGGKTSAKGHTPLALTRRAEQFH